MFSAAIKVLLLPVCFFFIVLTLSNHCLIILYKQSYGRAIELDDTSIFPLLESGNIFLMLGNFRKVRFC